MVTVFASHSGDSGSVPGSDVENPIKIFFGITCLSRQILTMYIKWQQALIAFF
jgi:hypothetical protein